MNPVAMRLLFVGMMAAAASLVAAQESRQIEDATEGSSITMSLEGGRWFDGQRFAADHWYVVDGALTRDVPATIHARIDLGGRHVLPPFAEAHNHDFQNAFFGAQSSVRYLEEGVFYSAQMCANPEGIAGFASFLNRPNTVDVVFARACISSSDGHPLGIALASTRAAGGTPEPGDFRDKTFLAVDTLQDLEDRWPRVRKAQTTLLKVILMNSEHHAENRGNPELFGYNGMDPALLPEVMLRARRDGMRVAVHVDSAHDFAVAAGAGADFIAHLPGYRFAAGMSADDYRLSDDAIAAAVVADTTVILTAVAARHFIERRPELADQVRAIQTSNINRLREAGVSLATGSDLVGSGSVLDEIEYLDALGVIPRPELLYVATTRTPQLLFPGRKIGSFHEGAEASLIVLEGNPIQDLGSIRKVFLRLKQGNLLAPDATRRN